MKDGGDGIMQGVECGEGALPEMLRGGEGGQRACLTTGCVVGVDAEPLLAELKGCSVPASFWDLGDAYVERRQAEDQWM